MVLEWQNVGNNMQLYIIFVHFVGRCVTITKYQCQSSSENNNNGDGPSNNNNGDGHVGTIVGIVIGILALIMILGIPLIIYIINIKVIVPLKSFITCSRY